MTVKFRIDFVLNQNETCLVLAECQEAGARFAISDSSHLGGVRLQRYLDMPRKPNPDGTLDMNAFIFKLADHRDAVKLHIGQIVDLEP